MEEGLCCEWECYGAEEDYQGWWKASDLSEDRMDWWS